MSPSSAAITLRQIPDGIEFGCASYFSAHKTATLEHRILEDLRAEVAAWAFSNRSVCLINCVDIDLHHFVPALNQFVSFETHDGSRYLISHHENCPADLLRAAAAHQDFELNFLCIAVLENCDRADLERLLESTSLDPAGAATNQEVMHCTGDSDGYIVRWLNPARAYTEIVSAIAGFCENHGLRLDTK